ncbi:MAG: hypothetical protein NXY57DRAFT_962928 [Lentinula lateritia]|nr:MAG: hypothetical protein NXY57DRAFT_962928 [Lentinula lateritia]
MVAEAEAAEGEVGVDVEAEVDEHHQHHLRHHLLRLLLRLRCRSLGGSLPRPTTETKRDEAKPSGLSTTPHVHHHIILLLLLLLHSLLRRNDGQSLQSNDTTSANDGWLDDGITERNQTKYHFFIPTRFSFDSAPGCSSPSPPVRLLSDFTFSDSNSNPSNFSTSSTYAYAYTYATVPAFKAEFKSMWGMGIGGREPSALSSSSARPSGLTCQRVVEDIENSEVHSQSQSQLQSQSQAQSYSSLLPLLELLTSQEWDREVYIETPADDGGERERERERERGRGRKQTTTTPLLQQRSDT